MHYRSKSGRAIRIWNTRDGITPFIVHVDGEEFTHKDWSLDQRLPDHVPKVGNYVFVDLTIEKAVGYRTKYVERYWDDPEYPMKEHDHLGPMGKEGAIMHLAEVDVADFGGHPPDLVKVTADWVAGFLAGKRNMAGAPPPEPEKPRHG